MKSISYVDLLYLWNKGKKNGALNRLGSLKRGLFSVALEYCRMMGKIAHPKLVALVEGIAQQIRDTIGRKIFHRGMDRASAMIHNPKLMQVFPTVKRWIESDIFLFWLGTDLFVKKRSWVWAYYPIR